MQKDKSVGDNEDKMNLPVPSASPTLLTSSTLQQRSPVKATSLEHKPTSKRQSSLSDQMGNKNKRTRSTEEEYNQETVSLQNDIIESQTVAGGNGQKKDKKAKTDYENEKQRRVIIMKGSLPNLALPDGWIALNHRSGGIIYLHRQTRVCTWSRPYFIGAGSVRKHDVPVAAIPCFHQRRALSQDDEGAKDVRHSSTQNLKNGASVLNALNMTQKNGDIGEIPNEGVETETDNSGRDKSGLDVLLSVSNSEKVSQRDGVTDTDGVTGEDEIGEPSDLGRGSHVGEVCDTSETHDKLRNETVVTKHFSKNGIESSGTNNRTTRVEVVDSDELGVYLSHLWKFQLLSSEQEQNVVDVIQPEVVRELELPPSLECLPYSVRGVDCGKQQKKEWKLRTSGKTPVAILHEYCQRILQTKPIYLCSECDNPDSPFVAEVEIDGIKYGSGTASNKKVARHIAAESALEVLMPGNYQKTGNCQISKEELEFFDKVDILDPRVFDFCSKTSLPIPSEVLEECLKRNQGIYTSPIQFTTVCGQDKTLSFEIKCGKHSATGPCKNKRIGKQLASQAILKKLHPHLDKWGGLVRIYCDRPTDSIRKYKTDDSDTFGEKDDIYSNALPNSDTLECLKREMKKLHAKLKGERGMNEKRHSTEPVFTVDFS